LHLEEEPPMFAALAEPIDAITTTSSEVKGDSHQIWRIQIIQVTLTSL